MAKALVIGSGCREHAIVKSILDGQQNHSVYCYPGNAGISQLVECPKANVPMNDPEGLFSIARALKADLTIVGPELPLVYGVADCFAANGRLLLGPSRQASRLEGSKIFAKQFMRKYKIPTADFDVCDTGQQALTAISVRNGYCVVKADGLAGGKGVYICDNQKQAEDAVHALMVDRIYAAAGDRVVVEDRISGNESSLFILLGGTSHIQFGTAVDYKRAYDDDLGPNTGGMGAYSPCTKVFGNQLLKTVVTEEIIERTIDGLVAERLPYHGFLYIGLMLTKDGPKVIEYNVRLGDPEAQVVMPLLDSNKVGTFDLFLAAASGDLRNLKPNLKGVAVGVVATSGRYPEKEQIKTRIRGPIRPLQAGTNVDVYHGATSIEEDLFYAHSGRVLTVVGKSSRDNEEARLRAYQTLERISFEGMRYRTDIARNIFQ